MGFIYQEANAYGVEALVALERHYTPTEEKYCTAVTEAVRICDTYGIPERELVPQVRHIAAAEEYLLEHLSEDEETLQFLFTPLSGSNTCLAWFLVWDYVRPGGEKAYKYTGHTPQQRLRDIISAVGPPVPWTALSPSSAMTAMRYCLPRRCPPPVTAPW